MIDLIQNTLDGLSAGASYALLGVGFTLIFGVLRRANLSYGPAIMLGVYLATWASFTFHRLVLLAVIAVVGTMLTGAYVERLCFAPHRRGPAVAAMAASFAIWMQLEELATLLLRHAGKDALVLLPLGLRSRPTLPRGFLALPLPLDQPVIHRFDVDHVLAASVLRRRHDRQPLQNEPVELTAGYAEEPASLGLVADSPIAPGPL